MLEFMNKLLAFGTILSQLFIVAIILHFIFFRTQGLKSIRNAIAFISSHGILFAFITSLLAMLSSLFYSNIAGFPPCELCWYQRIFMYPLVIILGIAHFRRDKNILHYAMPLAVIGFIISLYHNVIYYKMGGLSAICNFSDIGVSCIQRYVFELGYVTIPLMALTAFAMVIMLLVLNKLYLKNKV